MTSLWLAQEKARGDQPDAFWPFDSNPSDHGRGAYHAYPRDSDGPVGDHLNFTRVGVRNGLSCRNEVFGEAGGPPLDYRPAGAFPDYNSDFSVSFWYYVGDADVNQVAGLVAQTSPVFAEFEDPESPPFEEPEPSAPPPPGVWAGWAFIYHAGLVRFAVARRAPVNQVEAVANAPGGWVHVAGTAYRNTETPYVHIALYVNGRPAVASYSGEYFGFGPAGSPVTFGAYKHQIDGATMFAPLEGSVALVRAYQRVLRPAEVAEIYEREACWRKHPPASSHAVVPRQTGGVTLFVHGSDTHFGIRTLYIQGEGIGSGCTLYVRGTPFPDVDCDAELPMVVGGETGLTGTVTLFVGEAPKASLGLFVEGGVAPVASAGLSLYLSGSTHAGYAGSPTLVVEGGIGEVDEDLVLFVGGPETGTSLQQLTLFTGGHYPFLNGGTPLYLFGAIHGSCPGVWQHWDVPWNEADDANWNCSPGPEVGWANGLPMLLAGSNVGPASRGMNLYVRSAHGGDVPLFIQGPAGTQTAGLTLAIGGAVAATGNATLYVRGHAGYTGGTTLYSNGF